MSYPALDIVYSIELLYKGAEAGRGGIKVTGAAHAVILMRKMIVIMRRDLTQLFLSNYTESLTRNGTSLLIYYSVLSPIQGTGPTVAKNHNYKRRMFKNLLQNCRLLKAPVLRDAG